MTERRTYDLTPEEAARLDRLHYREGHAFGFWKDVAAIRGLDYRTILADGMVRYRFTALPLGWDRAWCYPHPIKCRMTVAETMAAAGRR